MEMQRGLWPLPAGDYVDTNVLGASLKSSINSRPSAVAICDAGRSGYIPGGGLSTILKGWEKPRGRKKDGEWGSGGEVFSGQVRTPLSSMDSGWTRSDGGCYRSEPT